MKWKQILWRTRYAMQYFPFTLNTLLFTIAVLGARYFLYKPAPKGEYESPLMPFIILMGKMALWFLVGLIIVSVVSTFVSFVYYLILKRDKGNTLQLEFTNEVKKGNNRLFLNARLDGVIRPVLGFVKGRLFYDNNEMTDRFSLLSNKKAEKGLWRAAITGRSRLALPDIKEYDLKGGFIYFQDMLHLFSLAVAQPVSGHFYQPPILTSSEDADIYPKKTETLDVRIEQLRRVEGEYLNYKDFEAGDDVRRIVWKVYAKNRELVVRVPEMYEPFASHLYYYASFHVAAKAQWMGEGYMAEMLNYYKNCVWSVYDTLAKKEWDMRYIPDQSFNIPEQLTEPEKAARIISNSIWHRARPLQQYFNPRQGSVLCISSFTDPADLAGLLEQCDGSTVIYLVKTSHVLKSYAALNLLTRIIIRPPKDRLSKLRARWAFSPMRFQVARREQELEAMLGKSAVNWGVL